MVETCEMLKRQRVRRSKDEDEADELKRKKDDGEVDQWPRLLQDLR